MSKVGDVGDVEVENSQLKIYGLKLLKWYPQTVSVLNQEGDCLATRYFFSSFHLYDLLIFSVPYDPFPVNTLDLDLTFFSVWDAWNAWNLFLIDSCYQYIIQQMIATAYQSDNLIDSDMFYINKKNTHSSWIRLAHAWMKKGFKFNWMIEGKWLDWTKWLTIFPNFFCLLLLSRNEIATAATVAF